MRPFYFTVVFWGTEHRTYFTDLLLASLLSPNNIPALNRQRRNKFLIVTTVQDWTVLQDHVLFQQLCRYVEPVFFEMPFPQKHDLKMFVMSQGHKQVSMQAYADGAYGVYVAPDLILSDGSVAAMERLAEKGKKVVLCVAIRFRQETMLPELESKGFLRNNTPLTISSRELMAVGLRNLHSETLRYEFDAPYFADYPISVFWWISRDKDMIIHSFSWAPLVVDYGALENHDISTFEKWTLDGDYIYRNFPNPEDIYVVNDSDEITLVSFTKEADLHFDLIPDPQKSRYGLLTQVYKIELIRSLKDSVVMDPLKRRIFSESVLLHSDPITSDWDNEVKRSASVIKAACRSSTKEEEFQLDVLKQSANNRVAKRILEQLSATTLENISNSHIQRLILMWTLVIRPGNILRKKVDDMEMLLRGEISWTASIIWFWRYRRFMWWRLKEKLWIVERRGYRWQDGGWSFPAVSLMCPIYTAKWAWKNRKWLWKNRYLLGSWLKQNYGFLPIFSQKNRR